MLYVDEKNLLEIILDSWDRNNRILVNLLRALPREEMLLWHLIKMLYTRRGVDYASPPPQLGESPADPETTGGRSFPASIKVTQKSASYPRAKQNIDLAPAWVADTSITLSGPDAT